MNQEQGPGPIYHEVQKFRQAWIWVVVLAIVGLEWYAAVSQLLLHRSLGTNPMPDIPMVIFWFIFGIGLPALLFFSQLIIEFHGDPFHFSLFPFHRTFRRIAFTEIKQCKVRTYHPIREYGGWGIRVRYQGKAYNVSGDRGVQVELLNGNRLLIGSQRAEEFWRATPEEYRAQEGKSI